MSDSAGQRLSETAETTPPPVPPTHHLVLYRRGPGWLEGKSLFEQPLQGHAEHNAALEAEGLLVISGPLLDREGGLSVLAVADSDRARKIVAKDPAVKDGIFVAEVAPLFAAFPKELSGFDGSATEREESAG